MFPPISAFPAIAVQSFAMPAFSAKFGWEVIQRIFLFPERHVVQIFILSGVFIVLPIVALAYGVKKLYEKHFPQ